MRCSGAGKNKHNEKIDGPLSKCENEDFLRSAPHEIVSPRISGRISRMAVRNPKKLDFRTFPVPRLLQSCLELLQERSVIEVVDLHGIFHFEQSLSGCLSSLSGPRLQDFVYIFDVTGILFPALPDRIQ